MFDVQKRILRRWGEETGRSVSVRIDLSLVFSHKKFAQRSLAQYTAIIPPKPRVIREITLHNMGAKRFTPSILFSDKQVFNS